MKASKPRRLKQKKQPTLKAELWKLSFSESLRYVCFFAFLLGLGAGIHFLSGARSFWRPLSSKNLEKKLAGIFTDFDNKPWQESFWIGGTEIFPVRRQLEVTLGAGKAAQNNSLLGIAFEAGGLVQGPKLLMAVDREGKLIGISSAAGSCASLKGKGLQDLALRQAVWGMGAEKPEVDAETAKTISEGFQFFEKNKKAILKRAGPGFVPLRERLEKKAGT